MCSIFGLLELDGATGAHVGDPEGRVLARDRRGHRRFPVAVYGCGTNNSTRARLRKACQMLQQPMKLKETKSATS